ncbi:hypothetical protein AVEN_142551-1, partial [Araneus ventricosus]
TVNCI